MKSMMIYDSEWNNEKTFRMLPINLDAPFNEAFYDPTTKILAIISKEKIERIQMLPKLNDKGQISYFKVFNEKQEQETKHKEERVFMNAFYEYYLSDIKDIKVFIDTFAINPTHKSLSILKVKTKKIEK